MAKKLFIRTFGCQMNEYDSDKMADVLAASEEIVKTDTPDDADIILFNTCSVREKGAGARFPRPRPGTPAEARQSRPGDRRRRLRGQPGRVRRSSPARPTSTSFSDRRPCIACRS
jgi:hypothetical protein